MALENVKIPSLVYKRLSFFADKQGVSVSSLVNTAIEEWLKKKEKNGENKGS